MKAHRKTPSMSSKKTIPVDRTASHEALENDSWGASPPDEDSFLIHECHRLRRVPVGELTTDNLRKLIGQNIGLHFLLPLALEILESDPLAEGDFYCGDLLKSCLTIDSAFWGTAPEMYVRLKAIAVKAAQLPPLKYAVEREVQKLASAFAAAR